jgi:PAS domain S-box-containing protein
MARPRARGDAPAQAGARRVAPRDAASSSAGWHHRGAPHGAVLESLRDQTHRISRASYEAERRLRGIDSLKEHFEAGADGVVVLDDGGRILYVNRAAERITGFARDGLLGSELFDLVAIEQRELIGDTVSRVLAGANGDAFDLREFHDRILAGGTVTMPILERRIDEWIRASTSSR